MADKVKLLELDIDVESIISKSVQLKAILDQLREKQADFKKIGDTSSESYIKNAATIAKVSAEYNKNQQQLSNLATVNSKYLTIQERLSLSLDKESVSIAAARQNNSELLKIRNELNLKTEDGAKAAELINDKLDKNNEFIKENSSAYEKQKINIGNYKEDITAALNETGMFNGKLGEMNQIITALSGPFKLLKKDFGESFSMIRNSTKGTEDLTGAKKALAVATNIGTGAMRVFTLALAATGIGLIIASIALLIGYLKSFTPIVDKVEQALSGMGAVIKVLQQGVMSFVSGLTDLEGSLKKISDFVSDPIKGFREMGKAMGEAYDAAAKLQKQQQDLEDAMESQEIQSAKNRAEINRLNIQAKDRTKTDEERLALLAKAAKLEEEDFKQRKANSDEQMRIALQQIANEAKLTASEVEELNKRGFAYKEYVEKKTNNTDELFDKLKQAQLAQTAIENEFYTNQEKNINKQNKLIEDQEAAREKAQAEAEARAKKAEEARQKALDNAATKAKAELDYFLSTQGIRAKSVQEELAIAEKVRDKKLEIAKKEYEASEKTEADKLKLLTDQNNIKDEFLQKQVDATIANAQRELDQYIKNNQSKLDNDKYFSEESLRIEQERLQGIFDKKKAFLDLELEQGKLSQQAYEDAITAIKDENRIANEAATQERDAAQKETDLLNAQNQLALDEQAYQDKWALETARLKAKKDAAIANAKAINADTTLIEKLYAGYQKDIDREKNQAKMDSAAAVFGGVADLLGRESALGKAAAVTQAVINVAQGVTKAIADGGLLGIATGALVAISGGMSIMKIMNTKPPEKPATPPTVKLRRGGILTGKKHEFGGIPLGGGYEGEDGEAVMNAKTTKMFTPLLSALNVAGGGVAFGGVYPDYASNGFSSSGQGSSAAIDYDLLAEKIAEANRSLPTPSLSLEEFHLANDQYLGTIKAADF